jgi:hypothetical protein
MSTLFKDDNGNSSCGAFPALRIVPPTLPLTPSMLYVRDPVPLNPQYVSPKPVHYSDTIQKFNNRIHCELATQNSVTYYVPTYLVCVVKKLEKYDFGSGSVTVCITTFVFA